MCHPVQDAGNIMEERAERTEEPREEKCVTKGIFQAWHGHLHTRIHSSCDYLNMICSARQHFIMEGGRAYKVPTLCWLLHLDLAPFWFYTSLRDIWWFVWVLHFLVLALITNFSVRLRPQLTFIAVIKKHDQKKIGEEMIHLADRLPSTGVYDSNENVSWRTAESVWIY